MALTLWEELLPKLANISDDFSKNIQISLNLGLAALDEFAKDTLNGQPRDKSDKLKHMVAISEDDADENGTPKNASSKITEVTNASNDSLKEKASKQTVEQVAIKEKEKLNSGKEIDKQNVSKETDKQNVSKITNKENTSKETDKQNASKETYKQIQEDSGSIGDANSGTESDKNTSGGKKRNKDEAANGGTPDNKRHKRNASVRAQNIISKQVNVNLSAKLRRPLDEENKENRTENAPTLIEVKQEKMSLMSEEATATVVRVKQEPDDSIVMPPPAAPPQTRPRRGNRKKTETKQELMEETSVRRSTRQRKTTDDQTNNSVRSTRASSRLNSQSRDEETAPPAETRPKRTRAKKQTQEEADKTSDTEKSDAESSVEKRDGGTETGHRDDSQSKEQTAPPTEARTKRTRAKKQASAEQEKSLEVEKSDVDKSAEPADSNTKSRPKRTRKARNLSIPDSTAQKCDGPKSPTLPPNSQNVEICSPIISAPAKKMKTSIEKLTQIKIEKVSVVPDDSVVISDQPPKTIDLEETRLLSRDTIDKESDAGGIDKQHGTHVNMNETIVLNKGPALNETVTINTMTSDQMTNDSSLVTSDDTGDITGTPPRSPQQSHIPLPIKAPSSAVKERVQQFEQLANVAQPVRLTRTKTRALEKQKAESENDSPKENAPKGVLSAETLLKLNNIPPYKSTQLTASASKASCNIVTNVKSFLPMSASKAAPAREEKDRDRDRERDRESARKKKEAMLEARREEQRRRREQKMAAVAAAREAQARSRAAQLEARAQGWHDKLAHVDQGKLDKQRENEKKRLLEQKKAAETEERRRAEEAARLAKLEEQRQAELLRKKQQEQIAKCRIEEQKNEKTLMEMKKQYIEKKNLEKLEKMHLDNLHQPMCAPGTPARAPLPVHMADGFQYLNSDTDDEEQPKRPPPDWSRTHARLLRLRVQERLPTAHVDRFFSVQRHTPDLTQLFPGIDRRQLKRTSSAVWRTPPRLTQLREE